MNNLCKKNLKQKLFLRFTQVLAFLLFETTRKVVILLVICTRVCMYMCNNYNISEKKIIKFKQYKGMLFLIPG